MRYKASFITGVAAGYVLGARAGRERYEKIKRAARNGGAGHPGGGATLVPRWSAPYGLARSRVAQSAERPAVNRQVTGSSPVAGALHNVPVELSTGTFSCRDGAVAQPVRAGDS